MTGHNVLHASGLRRVRAARRAVRGADRQHPRVTHRGQHRQLPPSAALGWGLATTARRSVATTDVEFYQWTQWIFLQIFNSWFDPEAGRARPIDELVAEFEPDTPTPDGRPWAELSVTEQRRS